MRAKNSTQDFGWVGRALHWLGVALIFYLYMGVTGLDAPPKNALRDHYVTGHIIGGLLFTCLIVSRFVWRQHNINPLLHWGLAKKRRIISIFTHRFLYLLAILTCITGISSAQSTQAPLSAFHTMLSTILLATLTFHVLVAISNFWSKSSSENT